MSLESVLAILWLTLATLLLARLTIANVRVAAWRRSSREVEDPHWLALLRRLSREYGIERPVVLLENEETDVPVTWGVVYPVVLLPTTAARWDEEQRIAVLTHELAHVKRFDALTQLLAQLALALLWFHPLVWMAVRRMRLEREHACDDFVLVAGARASRYADELLRLARRLTRPTAPAAAALAMARRSELEGRLLAILDPATKRTAVRRARVALLTLAAILLATPLAAFRPAARVQTATKTALSQEPTSVRALSDTAAPSNNEGAPRALRAVVRRGAASVSLLNDQTHALASLTQRLGAIAPATLSMGAGLPGISGIRPDTEPPKLVDLETLIEVTKAAKRMTSDNEKGQLLALIAKRYQRSDALRDAYLEAVFTMTSDHERSQALIALLDKDSLPLSAVAQVLRSTAMMTSDMNKGMVLKRISPSVFADSAVQRAYLDAIVAMTSDVERGAAITSLAKQRPLTPAVQLALLHATVAITSNVEKSNVLLLFLEKQGIGDDKVRRAFFKAAESLTSDTDYRRIMTAVMK
jgi:beta-lactamase regulating signal transducer with metallopeptidase domain